MKIAVFGASGFAGNAITRALHAAGQFEVATIIRSAGSAWDLAKDGFALHAVDVLDPQAVASAVRGCQAVVNCTRGDDEVMLGGLKTLLAQSRAAGVGRFIHLSSVAVYGDPPPPESVEESARANPPPNSYGSQKLAQDKLVTAAHEAGRFETVMLCPPNISGPQSPFLLGVLDAVRLGRFALLDEPDLPCSLVDVDNLAAAVVAAIEAPSLPGERLFVVDDERASWADLVAELSSLLPGQPSVPTVDRATLEAHRPPPPPRPSLRRSLKHLVSSSVREALRRDPLWERSDKALRRLVARSSWLETRLIRSIEGPLPVEPFRFTADYDWRLCLQQLRGVHHSAERAKQAIGYRPAFSFTGSMQRFGCWHEQLCGTRSEDWELLSALQ